MSWTTFKEVGKLRDAAKACAFPVRLDLSDGVQFVFPDGWKIDAHSKAERRQDAITGWLTALWTIRSGRVTDDKKQICK